MNRKTRALTVAAGLLVAAVTACTDPTVAPVSTVNSENIFTDVNSYRAFLAKIYGGLIITGQQGPAGNRDIEAITDEGFSQYLRLHWYMNEMPTDEAVIGWNDRGLRDLNTATWGAGNEMVNAMWSRVFFQVMLANEFLRQTTDAKLSARGQNDAPFRATIATYRAEARFLRALSYWHGIDFFGDIPLVTENDALGSTPPPQAARADIYNFIVAELIDIADELPPAGVSSSYNRATPYAAHMLLAKLYLNAEVYSGTPNWTGALTEAAAVIAGPYTLEANFRHNFTADNNLSSELVFVAAQDGANTQTWGGMTFLVHAGCGGAMSAGNYGIDYCWGGYRMKPETFNRFAATDGRASFFFTPDSAIAHGDTNNDGSSRQTIAVTDIGNFSSGIPAPKFVNYTSTGGPAQQTTMPDTDFPVFRLADAMLMYAEAHVRGGGGTQALALQYVNAIRARAGGIGAWTAAELTLDSLLQERGRELLFEGHRRTDLIRYGRFESGAAAHLWAWKGGVIGGQAIPNKALYPIPSNELIANPNLTQNPGY